MSSKPTDGTTDEPQEGKQPEIIDCVGSIRLPPRGVINDGE